MPGTAPVPVLTIQPVNGVVAGNPLSGSVVADQPFQLVRLFSGAGAPSATTLSAATASGPMTSNGKYLVNDLYLDTTANAMWRCTTAGSNSTSVWAQVSGGASSAATMFIIRTLLNCDYVTGDSFDGSIIGAYIAKSPRLRPSVLSEVIDGVTIAYTLYTLDNNRTASDGNNSEFQVVFPRYAIGIGTPANIPVNHMSIIFCVPIASLTLSGNACTWLEVSPARVWARRYTQ